MTTLVLLSSLGLVSLFTGLFKSRKFVLPLVLTGLLAIFVVNALDWNQSVVLSPLFNNMLKFDNFAIVFSGLIIFLTMLVFLLTANHKDDLDIPFPEVFTLMIFAIIGGLVMTSYNHLVMLFIGIETLSISVYILAGSRKKNLFSNEASLKYFLMGAFATGFLLFGIALLYGATGSFHLDGIRAAIDAGVNEPILLFAGILLIMMGLAFKISAVPFHFWTPDVYEGAPTLVTTFMSTVVKTAAVAAFFRLFYLSFSGLTETWTSTIWVISALTMTVGNVTAVYQNSFKRLLAYSGIAHAGYLLLAIMAMNQFAGSAILFYLVAYAISTIAAFAILMKVQQQTGSDKFESFYGFARKNPFQAFVAAAAMCSLAGIPPAAGFFGKFYIFSAAIQQGYLWIVIIAILNSCIGIFYYFRLIIAMYMKRGEQEFEVEKDTSYSVVLLISLIGTLLLGIFPDLLIKLL